MQRSGWALLAVMWARLSLAADDPSHVTVHGPRDQEVRDALSQTLNALDLDGTVDVELAAAPGGAVRYIVRVARTDGAFVRRGVVEGSHLLPRVTSTVLLGLLARQPDRFRPIALVTDCGAVRGTAVKTWHRALERRGYVPLDDGELALVRRTVGRSDDPFAALHELLGAEVVTIECRSESKQVSVQLAVYDDGPVRGDLELVAPDDVEDEVATWLTFAPLVSGEVR